ncbi:putative carbonic anhydrase-like protein 2 [Hypsibius exemplaris]|uniref:Carbonic anhydrase-like protein 2 n=1 Tax=Hypsibius exemplaris TaxID=2072580 RepID=A0A1W0WY47_HYPEX|nr:putative carbonic anhydrase-like protein 2 [Hypsibius exemplaris]
MDSLGIVSRQCLRNVLVWILLNVFLAGKSLDNTGYSWDEWWSYDGISGSDFWGSYNPDWELCSKGQFQSPVDIDPAKLLFQPNLPLLNIDQHKISGNFTNTGHGLAFSVINSTDEAVNVTFRTSDNLGYVYRLHEIHIHWGSSEHKGSEHKIHGQAFPGEVQLFTYNSVIYHNFSHAQTQPHGLLAISVFLQIGDKSNTELAHLLSKVESVRFRDQSIVIQQLSVKNLLPQTQAYVTYPGSLTRPGCQETVQWVVMNKPIYITKQQLNTLRQTRKGDGPKAAGPLMENNFRAVRKMGEHRIFRTNIDLSHTKNKVQSCPSMYSNFEYQAKKWSIV